MSSDRSGDDKDGDKDRAVARTAGFVVFSGIAMSILKALNPLNKPKPQLHNDTNPPIADGIQSTQHHSLSPPQPIINNEKPITCVEKSEPESSSSKIIEIVKGDTLWGLSREYGVSIEAIKEANGLTGDTIYAGKKLVIP